MGDPREHSVSTNRARAMRREMTGAERRLWSRLRGHRLAGLHVRRQFPCGPFIADFAIVSARVAIEVDGATHSRDDEIARDAARDRWFRANEWKVLRFTNEDVYRRLDDVLETILARIDEGTGRPPLSALPTSPPLRGRESL